MAITSYVGLPGHGKSYGVVSEVIVPALKAKRKVFTNIPMVTELCEKRFGFTVVQFDVKDILENPNWFKDVFEAGSLFVLDEVYKLWPSGLKTNVMLEQHKSFLAEHRHMVGKNGKSTEVILIVQKLNLICMYCRSLIDTTFWVVKLDSVGLGKRYRVDVYSGAMDGTTPQLSKRHREIHGKFKDNIKDIYISHTMSETGSSGDETRTDSRFNVFKGNSVKLFLAFTVVIAVLVYFGTRSVTDGFNGSSESAQDNSVSSPVPSVAKTSSSGVKSFKSSFLSDSDIIRFSHSMTTVIDGNRLTDYYFKIIKNDSYVFLSGNDLSRLGYTFSVISECLIEISSSNFKTYVMCEHKEEDNSLLSSFTAPSVGSE